MATILDPVIVTSEDTKKNESFQEGNPNLVKGRWDLEELYKNISLVSDYSKYKNENLITNTTQKEKALKEFLEEYTFVSQISVNNTNYKNNKMFNKVS